MGEGESHWSPGRKQELEIVYFVVSGAYQDAPEVKIELNPLPSPPEQH
jgi:hypothetical protein